jgi:hypothetical protein
MTTPQEARTAVKNVLAEVPPEHEAAYRVIHEAVRVCIESGMERKVTAVFLGISRWRIDKRGQYFRSLRATRQLFRSAFNISGDAWAQEDFVDAVVRQAWKR